MADDEPKNYTVTLAQQIFGKAAAIPGHIPPAPAPARHSSSGESSPPASLPTSDGEDRQKQVKTAAELAELIESDLARHPDCPKAGFRVTVYGWPYWRTMLTITPAAGVVRNPQEWRDLTDNLAERLRKRYDLAWKE